MLARLESLNFFCSIPGKEFIDFRESRLATTWQHAYCARDNCHLSLQLAISRLLVHFAAAVACIPDTWTPRNSGVSKWYGTAYQTRFGRATTGYVDRPQAAMSTSSGTDWRAGRRSPPPFAPPLAIQLRSRRSKVCTRAKSRVSIKTWELRLSTRECNFPGINIRRFYTY